MSEVKPYIDGVAGFTAAGVACGLKKSGALDFALIVSDIPASAAGVFTTNQVKAAPVLVDQEKLRKTGGRVRAVAINSGCANACTGQQGMDAAYETARCVAAKIGCHEDEVLVMSTGVIGTQLDMGKIRHGVDLAVNALNARGWDAAAHAMMTTDTRPKMASLDLTAANGKAYTVAGLAKGAGMIAPNMATMLGLLVANASYPAALYTLLADAAEVSFNRIVVDGDMSTNDTLLLLTSGHSGAVEVPVGQYPDSVRAVSRRLAQDIVRDGEGVTKFLTLMVTGTPDPRAVASAIATSPLVKTAFYGGDANWGRIVAAAGRAGAQVHPESMKLWIAAGEGNAAANPHGLLLFDSGVPTTYDEAQAAHIFSQSNISILLDCGGDDRQMAVIWTCDLSHEYVSINGDYRS